MSVEISVNIQMKGVRAELTYAEAKELYDELHSIFGAGVVYYQPLPYCQPSYPGVYPWTYTAGSSFGGDV